MVVRRRTVLTGAVASAAVGVLGLPAHAATRPPALTDLAGRVLVPAGLNTSSSAKSAPDAMPWVRPRDLAAEVRTLHTNTVRLLVFWARVEPQPGRYDHGYLDAVAERVDWYRDLGVRVIIDMHQDVWGPAAWGGAENNNGAPRWATYFDGLPAEPQEPWALGYLQPGVIRAFDHLWGTTGQHPELAEHFAATWVEVARRFRDDPTVLGFDLFNEPWGGSVPSPVFEPELLAPFYQRVIDAIRTVDDQHWIFVEPQAFGVNQGLPSTLPALGDPRAGEARIGYAPHLYPALISAGRHYTGATRLVTRRVVRSWFAANLLTAQRLGAPMLVGEFGLDATLPGSLDYVDDVLADAADAGVGWLYWSNDHGPWGPYRQDGGWAPLAGHLAAR